MSPKNKCEIRRQGIEIMWPPVNMKRPVKTAISILSLKSFFLLSIAASMIFVLASPLLADLHGYLDADGFWRFNSAEDSPGQYSKAIKQASKKFEVESALIAAVIKAESDFNHRAVSNKGAKGLMQLMPATASLMDLDEPFNPKENITAGARYLSMLLSRFKYNKTLALAAYNSGPETVDAYGGMPPFPETRDFVRRVLRYYKLYAYMDRI
jgi:soluble lytic murein transglycosylase-like protein